MEDDFAGHPLPEDLAEKDELDEADEMEIHEAEDAEDDSAVTES